MMQNVKQALALTGILIALATLCWYRAQEPLTYRLDAHTLSTMPDQQITELEVRQFNTQGQLVHHLTTPFAHHIPEHNQHWIKTPHINAMAAHQPAWSIHAMQATTYMSQDIQHGVYRGKVTLDQGDTHLRADNATTQSDAKNQLLHATAYGNAREQAHIWITPSAKKPPIHAYADRIDYEPQALQITFSGHARLMQGDETFSAPVIVYDLQHKQILTQPRAKQRTEIIIHSSLKRSIPHA